jgi:glycosyltransferase 2 family protein
VALPSTRESAEEKGLSADEVAHRDNGGTRRGLRLSLLAVGVLLAVLLFRAVGWPAIASNLERIGAVRFFLLAALYLVTQVVSALGWWLVIQPRPAASRLPSLFAIYLAGDSLNYIAPGGVAGEPVKMRLLGRTTGMGAALASLTVHKHADLVAQCAFVTLGVAYAVLRFPMPLAARFAAIAGAAGLVGLLLLLTWAMRRGTYRPILRRLASWRPLAARLDRYQRSAGAVDAQIRDFYGAHRSRYLASVALGILGWCGGMLETYLILRLLSPAADWGTALAVEALAMALNNMLLFVPGRVGSAEGVRAAVFLLLGMPAALGVAYALVRRGRELVWVLPGLAVLVQSHSLSLLRRSGPELSSLGAEESRP